ncbi:thioredoxin fold domain-containing protein [Stakelama sp. CBK3Z-3]|uniref:Thioredoxin n=1 Tax=Stakelama flava TaxID=2860338 RepID=A0ABS6XPL9_9SPHN|nr:thioredoxin domain-containing protein [Stakelama flava]MBW4332165.1 thioredoxin fold domain-containing protein [Stakelama flava]
MANIEKITDANFSEKVLGADRPVLVDFTAAWCGPCKAMAPAVEDIAREYDGEATVYLMDIDESPDTRHGQGIMGVPTFMIFNHGEMIERFSGSMSRSKLAAALEAVVADAG